MKKLILTFILAIFTLFACERFEHKLEPDLTNIGLDEFASSLQDLFSNTTESNYLEIGSLYSNQYYNSGFFKSDMLDYFGDFFIIDPNTNFTVDNVIISSAYTISWNFKAFDSFGEVVADTTFNDYLISENNGYLIYGNQSNKRKVVVELFTGQWCSNCPNAEEALHHLRSKYSSRFSYVEYHFGNDELAIDDSPIFYYPFAGTLPFGIVNGNALLLYEAPDPQTVEGAIQSAIDPILQEELLINLEQATASIAGTMLSGSIQIGVDSSIDLTDLKLVTVLMEEYNDVYLNHHGYAHHNIALKRSTTDLADLDLTQPVDFEITALDDLPTWYNGVLPNDLKLVLWVQTLTSAYDEAACAAYNVIEIEL